ncbi:polymer-forming cytoskeletal protein [Acidaminobacter sp. JC074]|uniref:bactofilin family protein n=1 Tax=Acidaminobacter sp. JC074 TaxID=2530199 RepID=UPI001F0DE2AA|nr:polymer-forming cytoskeletal protein [Acidaminobacter sp. JC074]MCH4890749.1 polymer-forming cytoskeletal protein [Acidaminobacter sp. JC074]
MAFKKNVSKDFDVIVGLNSSVDGDIVSEGSVRIDGKVSGSIKSKGDVIIGANAVVNSDIEAVFCEISGQVTGSVHSDTQLKIYKSGSLKGDITVTSFTIEEGGVFKGNCDINPDPKEKKSVQPEKNSKPKEVPNNKNNNQNKDQNKQNQKKTV